MGEPFWTPRRRGEWGCPHGVGHHNGVHGCDGCCGREDFPLRDGAALCRDEDGGGGGATRPSEDPAEGEAEEAKRSPRRWGAPMPSEIKPIWDEHGVPVCTEDKCPQFDGKRCRAFGWQPDRICEPAVRDMAERLRKLGAKP